MGNDQGTVPGEERDQAGRTALWYSVSEGDTARLRQLLAEGFAVNAPDRGGYTPLHLAAMHGCLESLQCLLEAGADPNATDQHGNGPLWTALLSAPREQKVPLARRLLAAGADPYHENAAGRTPHGMATEIGHGLEVPFQEVAI